VKIIGQNVDINKVGNIEVGSIVKITRVGGNFIFARIEKFTPNIIPDWYNMDFTIIFFSPEQCSKMSWVLRAPQINGEQFEMGDKKMIIDLILPPIGTSAETPTEIAKEMPKEGKVIPFKKNTQ